MKEIAAYEAMHGRLQTFEFNTVAAIGPTGCGKTLTTTWIGNNFSNRGFPVVSNYHMYGIKTAIYVEDPMELLRADAIAIADEIQKFVNSRLGADKRTIFYSELTSEARKSTQSLYCASQRFMNIDVKVRNNVDYVLFPDYNKELHWCTVYAFEGINYEKPFDIFEFDAIPVYEMFKTKEKVKSSYTSDTRASIEELTSMGSGTPETPEPESPAEKYVRAHKSDILTTSAEDLREDATKRREELKMEVRQLAPMQVIRRAHKYDK